MRKFIKTNEISTRERTTNRMTKDVFSIDEESEDRSCQPPPLKVKKTLGSLIHQDAKVIADPASLTSTVST